MKMVDVDKAGEPLKEELDKLLTMRERAFRAKKTKLRQRCWA